MVAGRHFFGAIDRNPSVHWVAYQDFLRASRNMESGVVNLTTWYTGSQCVSLPLRYSYDNTQSIFVHMKMQSLHGWRLFHIVTVLEFVQENYKILMVYTRA